ncbi:ABC transporter permease [Sphaerisporangium corydalis]|uniref:ABC transporter permease n=1 Tax=Sphaerisporangium corydalis TaxID=1441875 RepID=A0ABV9EC54_9ACTN|nr:ABC transporter permease [Sphaerisporangium corydalis]
MTRVYVLLVVTWIRAAAQYPVSMTLLTAGSFLVTGLDMAAIAVIFSHVGSLGGFTLPEVMFLYGASGMSFALADLLFGNVDRLGQHVKAGTFDAMLIRPVSPFVQIAVERFSFQRLGRVAQAATVLAIGLAHLHVPWQRLWMIPVMVVCGIVVFTAIWTIGSSIQFTLTDAGEVGHAFTYGGGQLTQYPLSVYGADLVRAVTFIVPLAFVNWQPGLYVLDRPDPLGLPYWLRFLAPAAALVLACVAALAWRSGLRRYRSTGS